MFELFFHNNKKMSSSLITQREMSSLRHPSIKLSICESGADPASAFGEGHL